MSENTPPQAEQAPEVPIFNPGDSPRVKAIKVGVEIVKQLVVMAMHGSKAAMAVLVVGGIVVAGGWVVGSGWLNRLTPAPPVVLPVTVTLDGPVPEAVVGSSYTVLATITGPSGKPDWEIEPATGATLTAGQDGHSARFSARDAGRYVIRVTVPGDGFQLAKAKLEIQALAISEPMPEPDEPAADEHQAEPPKPERVPTVAELTAAALANVESPDKIAEAHIIAGSIKSVIARIETGLVSPETDAMAEVETQVREALGAQMGDWDVPFFGAMAVMFDSLRSQGAITTAASSLPTLKDMAAVLQGAR